MEGYIFKKGDHIVANERSNDHYSITNQSKGWKGVVQQSWFEDGQQMIRAGGYSVRADCFDLDPEFHQEELEPIDPPGTDLFGGLF